jgi:2'-5' RNA ligase
MADQIKRRKLGGGNQQQNRPNNQQQNNPRPPQQQGQGQPRSNQGQRPNQGQQRPQQGQRHQNRPNPGQQRPPQRHPAPKPAPPPPAYFQRDLLLIGADEENSGLSQVRAKLDPLAKKLPPHITLFSPEPAQVLNSEILKNLHRETLPQMSTVTFSQVIVHNEMYLWLMPDDESSQKITEWHQALVLSVVGQPSEKPVTLTQDEFIPHLTLGYIPRSLSPEDAVAFAKNLITLPLILNFNKVILEEFSENQISNQIDAINLVI